MDRPDRERIAKELYEYASKDIQEFIDEFKVDVPRKPREWEDKPEGSAGKEYWYKRADQILALLIPDIEEITRKLRRYYEDARHRDTKYFNEKIKEAKREGKEGIFKAIEAEFFATPQDIPQLGREPVLGCIVKSFWQALKDEK